jgi:hypothetical protein
MPDKPASTTAAARRATWGELDEAERAARLAAQLRANLARRKRQGRARDAADEAAAEQGPALDRDGGDA